MNKNYSLIDFFDSSLLYLNILISSAEALKYYAQINENDDLFAVGHSIDFAVSELRKNYKGLENYLLPNKKKKGGADHE